MTETIEVSEQETALIKKEAALLQQLADLRSSSDTHAGAQAKTINTLQAKADKLLEENKKLKLDIKALGKDRDDLAKRVAKVQEAMK